MIKILTMNSPEEKAKELVEKFKQHSYYDGHDMTTRRQREESNVDSAKECAEICVDEILDSEKTFHSVLDKTYDYWQKVKEEIQKI